MGIPQGILSNFYGEQTLESDVDLKGGFGGDLLLPTNTFPYRGTPIPITTNIRSGGVYFTADANPFENQNVVILLTNETTAQEVQFEFNADFVRGYNNLDFVNQVLTISAGDLVSVTFKYNNVGFTTPLTYLQEIFFTYDLVSA